MSHGIAHIPRDHQSARSGPKDSGNRFYIKQLPFYKMFKTLPELQLASDNKL